MPDRLPRTLRRRWFDDHGRPLCRECQGRYRDHHILWRVCHCRPGCTCTQYVGGLVAS